MTIDGMLIEVAKDFKHIDEHGRLSSVIDYGDKLTLVSCEHRSDYDVRLHKAKLRMDYGKPVELPHSGFDG